MTLKLQFEYRENDEFLSVLADALLVSSNEKFLLKELIHYISYQSGEIILTKSEPNSHVYYVKKGRIKILSHRTSLTPLAYIMEGDLFGEVSSILKTTTNAFVVAADEVELGIIDINQFEEKKTEVSSQLLLKFSKLLTKKISDKLNDTNETLFNELEAKVQMLEEKKEDSLFLSSIFIGLTIYTLSLEFVKKLAMTATANGIISSAIIILFSTMALYLMKISKRPWADFGLHLNSLTKNILWGMGSSLPFLLVLAIYQYSKLDSLFNPMNIVNNPQDFSWSLWGGMLSMYAILAIFQEIIGRGAIHTALRNFFRVEGEKYELKALIISNLMFSATHMHLGHHFALLAFIPGLLWGWLYIKTNSLIAPIISHILIGVMAVFFLGFN